jgi:hypothetical protein
MKASAAGFLSRKGRQTPNGQTKEWQRIYRQTLTLVYKNFLIFYKSPISLILRALVFPIVITIIFSELKHLGEVNSGNGPDWAISQSSFPVKDLSDAMSDASKNKLVFVRNGIANETFGPVVDGILAQPGMSTKLNHVVDNPNDLFDLCEQTTSGSSDCYAAVIFNAANDTTVEYTVALDNDLLDYGYGKVSTDDTKFANRVVPLQWALESHIGGFPYVAKPSLQPYGGVPNYYSLETAEPAPQTGLYWYIPLSHSAINY